MQIPLADLVSRRSRALGVSAPRSQRGVDPRPRSHPQSRGKTLPSSRAGPEPRVVLRRVTTGSSVDDVGGVSNVRLSGGWRSDTAQIFAGPHSQPIVRQRTTLRVFAAAAPQLPCTQARYWDTGARVRSDPLGVSRMRSLRGKLQRAGPTGHPFARTVSDPRVSFRSRLHPCREASALAAVNPQPDDGWPRPGYRTPTRRSQLWWWPRWRTLLCVGWGPSSPLRW